MPPYLNCQGSGDSSVRFPMGALPSTLFGPQTHMYLQGPSNLPASDSHKHLNLLEYFRLKPAVFADVLKSQSSLLSVPGVCSESSQWRPGPSGGMKAEMAQCAHRCMAAHEHLRGRVFLQSAAVADGEKERKQRNTASQTFRYKGCVQTAGIFKLEAFSS